MTHSSLVDTGWWFSSVVLLSALVNAPAAASDYAALRAWLQQHTASPSDSLAPGIYDQTRIADLAAYLPPGYADECNFPELSLEIVETQRYSPHRTYQEASERYIDTAHIKTDGDLGNYVAGLPFRNKTIRTAPAAQAGYMVAWNHVHRWEYFGFTAPETMIGFISPSSGSASSQRMAGMEGGGRLDRSLSMFYARIYLSKLAPLADNDYRMDVAGSDELLFKERIELLAPFDIAGSTIIVERPINQKTGDLINSYLPSERRVRRLSAKERADSWMGTNWTLDDFAGYSGMVMDNVWTYLGEKVIAYVANTRHEQSFFHGPMSVIPLDRWQLRPTFVVTAVPRWDGHPYGRRVLFIDAETYVVAMGLIYDRNDALYKIVSGVYARDAATDEADPSMTTSRMRASIVANVRDRNANIARVIKPTYYDAIGPSDVRRMFSVADLNRGR